MSIFSTFFEIFLLLLSTSNLEFHIKITLKDPVIPGYEAASLDS
jgi:hypothetical protein